MSRPPRRGDLFWVNLDPVGALRLLDDPLKLILPLATIAAVLRRT